MNIIISMATRGDENIGFRVKENLNHLNIPESTVSYVVANPAAVSAGVRFVESDLNRSFPGNPHGTLEERRAHELAPLITQADIVIDIHSTTSDLKNCLIVTKLNVKTLEYLKVINAETVLLMNVNPEAALISGAKVGIAFEYGSDTDEDTINHVASDLTTLFRYLKIVDERSEDTKPCTSRFYDVFALAHKPQDFELLPGITNFSEVTAGTKYAYNKITDEYLVAEENFYPILFGEKKYKTYFGFMAKSVDLEEITPRVH